MNGPDFKVCSACLCLKQLRLMLVSRVFCKLVTEIKQNVNMNAISSGSAGSRNNANCRRKFSNNGGGVTSASTGEKEDSSTSACNDMLHDSIAESLQEGLMECLRVGLNLTNESG